MRQDFLTPSSLITGQRKSVRLKLDYQASARFVIPKAQGLVLPYVAKFSPHDFLLIATAGEEGQMSLVRGHEAIRRNEYILPLEHSFPASPNTIFDLTFLKTSNNLLCAGSADKTVDVVDTVSLKTITSYTKHIGSVLTVNDSPNGVLSGSRDGGICLWDLRSKDPVFYIPPKTACSISSLVSPTNDLFLSSDSHGRITAWDVRAHKQMMQIPMPATENRTPISHMALSPNGKWLASLLTNNTLLVHKLDGTWSYAVQQWANIGQHYIRCSFSPDSKYIVTGSSTGSLCVFEVGVNKPPSMLLGHTAVATCVEWCPTSCDHILSCSDDRSIQIWTSEYESCFSEEEDTPEQVFVIPEEAQEERQEERFYTLHHFFQ